ncbi:MAG: CRTAC1 family protein, partial [Limisphaerales bacterium]
VVAATIAAGFWWLRRAEVELPPVETEQHGAVRRAVLHNVSSELVNEVLRIEAEERRVAETVWAKEMLAQECGRTIERLWDETNAATNKLAVVARFGLGEVQLGRWDQAVEHGHGIRFFSSSAAGDLLRGAEWQDTISRLQSSGWNLEQIEFRHNRFEVDAQGRPARSMFYFAANLLNASETNRVSIEGDLEVHWGEKSAEDGSYEIRKVDARGLTLKTRRGEPLFKLVLDEEIIPQGQSKLIDPLIVYDLNGDGLSEIILAGRNLVYRNRGDFEFSPEALCKYPEEFIKTALVADFGGDGVADFLCKKWEGLYFFKGSTNGTFETRARLAWKSKNPLAFPMVMTCGDIDTDGDLDIFIGQYKEPYEGGATPKPFYDANDGEPAYLLMNEGNGVFRDATEAAGLGEKRRRRTYSASFADLDGDADLDLLVVSDFAGLDLYRNDGKGRFMEATREWLQPGTSARGFGMAHALSDFNGDGFIDLLMMGMTSPAVERIDHLGLARNEGEIERTMRGEMTHGNRLYLGTTTGRFEEIRMSETIARSGWSWGCSAFDFDNDGFVDVYVGNGLESNLTVADYESEYWLHDRFVGVTNKGSAADVYFRSKFTRTRGQTQSYGGHERNRMFINQRGTNFLEVGYLLGVALLQDSRNVVADDLDEDGRVDLVVTTYEIGTRGKQTLKVFRNATPDAGNWAGLRFDGRRSARAWPGTAVRLKSVEQKSVRQMVTGDSYRSQHAPVAHFGLGNRDSVNSVEIKKTGEPVEHSNPVEVNSYRYKAFINTVI